MEFEPLFKNDKPHFHTGGGELAVGYMIYTYYAGTSTPAAMYSDPSGATQYQNPIVLNSRGEPDGQGIYAKVSHKYKVVFKNPDGGTVWSMDDVSPMGVGDITVEGMDKVYHDSSLSGDGTDESPLSVNLPDYPVKVFYEDYPYLPCNFESVTFTDLDDAVKAHKIVYIVKRDAQIGQVNCYMPLIGTGGGHLGDPRTYTFHDFYGGNTFVATQNNQSTTGLTWAYSQS
jgi:hypothetical protein